ncbi:MAG: DUF5385 family protein [Mycoplasmoidaceae bacterium]
MNNNLFALMLVIIPIGVFIYFIKKKKGNSEAANAPAKRRDNDEVWKTLKSYIKKNSEYGKEVIESYVAKRPPINHIDKSLPKVEYEKAKKLIKEEALKEKAKRKEFKKQKKRYTAPAQKELYVVLFTTRNPKTLEEDKPRAIECQVINNKIDKKNFEREIIVTRTLNYEEEAKWILPIKEKEEAQFNKDKAKKEKNALRKNNLKKKLKIKEKDPKKKSKK